MKKIVATLFAIGLTFTAVPSASAAPTTASFSKSVQEVVPNAPTLSPSTCTDPLGVVTVPKQPRGVTYDKKLYPLYDEDMQAWVVRFELKNDRFVWDDSSQSLWYASNMVKE